MHGRGRAEKELILFRGGWTRAYSPTYIYVYENVRIRVFAWKARLIRFSTFISRDNKDSWPQSVILYREIVHLEFSFKRVLIPYPRFSPLYNPFFFFFFKYFNPSRSSFIGMLKKRKRLFPLVPAKYRSRILCRVAKRRLVASFVFFARIDSKFGG